MFTARYELIPYKSRLRSVFKGLRRMFLRTMLQKSIFNVASMNRADTQHMQPAEWRRKIPRHSKPLLYSLTSRHQGRFNQSFIARNPSQNPSALSGRETGCISIHQASPFSFDAKVISNLRHIVWGGKVTFSFRALQARTLSGRLVPCWINWRNDEVPAKHEEI